MSRCLNSLNRGYVRDFIGDFYRGYQGRWRIIQMLLIKEDIRSSGYSSNNLSRTPSYS